MLVRPNACESTTLIGRPCVKTTTREPLFLRRGGFVQGCEHTGAECVWLRAEIANWILQKPRPSLAALRAQRCRERCLFPNSSVATL